MFPSLFKLIVIIDQGINREVNYIPLFSQACREQGRPTICNERAKMSALRVMQFTVPVCIHRMSMREQALPSLACATPQTHIYDRRRSA